MTLNFVSFVVVARLILLLLILHIPKFLMLYSELMIQTVWTLMLQAARCCQCRHDMHCYCMKVTAAWYCFAAAYRCTGYVLLTHRLPRHGYIIIIVALLDTCYRCTVTPQSSFRFWWLRLLPCATQNSHGPVDKRLFLLRQLLVWLPCLQSIA